MGGVQSCLIILRILREMCRREPTWKPVTDWVSLLSTILTFLSVLPLYDVVNFELLVGGA